MDSQPKKKKKKLKTQYTCPLIHQLKQKNWDRKSINQKPNLKIKTSLVNKATLQHNSQQTNWASDQRSISQHNLSSSLEHITSGIGHRISVRSVGHARSGIASQASLLPQGISSLHFSNLHDWLLLLWCVESLRLSLSLFLSLVFIWRLKNENESMKWLSLSFSLMFEL